MPRRCTALVAREEEQERDRHEEEDREVVPEAGRPPRGDEEGEQHGEARGDVYEPRSRDAPREERGRGDRPREVEAEAAAGELGREEADPDEERAREREARSHEERGDRAEVARGIAAESRDERQQPREEGERRARGEDEPALHHLEARDGEERSHERTPFSSPATARKISSSDIGADCASTTPSCLWNPANATSSKSDTTASTPQPRTFTR